MPWLDSDSTSLPLNIKIEGKFMRMRPKAHGIHLLLSLVIKPSLNKILSEGAAFQQKSMVILQSLEHLVQAPRRGLHLDLLCGAEIVQILINRRGRHELLFNAIQSGEQYGAEGKVGIGRRVGTTKLDPLGLLAARVHRNAHAGAAIALRVDQVNGSLIARHQPSIGIGRRGTESQQSRSMREDAADVMHGGLTQIGIAPLGIKEICTI